jgi:hypothetical protein
MPYILTPPFPRFLHPASAGWRLAGAAWKAFNRSSDLQSRSHDFRASSLLTGAAPALLPGCRNPALAAKLEAERKLKEGISGHKTGLPRKLLELFEPLPLPPVLPAIPKRPPKLPYTGIAQYVDLFSEPGDAEYEPPPEVPRPPSPRRFRNPELAAQARVDYESKAEKCASLPPLANQNICSWVAQVAFWDWCLSNKKE